MKTLILAAGYATRLYPLTLHTTKPLLKLKNKPILDYIIDRLGAVEDNDRIYIVSNDKFYNQFAEWLSFKPEIYQNKIKLINDGSISVEGRLGAIGDINLVIAQEVINDDLLVVAGDNLFDFDLKQFIEFGIAKLPYHSICLYQANNGIDLTRFGIAQLNGDSQILNFEEKPTFPQSNLIATCIYFFPKNKLHLMSEYLNLGNHNDTPGSYIRWLTQHDKVYGNIFAGVWYDLGDFDSLSQAMIHLNGNKLTSRRMEELTSSQTEHV